MHRARISVVLAAVLLVAPVAYAEGIEFSEVTTTAVAGCPGLPAGNVPITSETRAAATIAGVPLDSPCWNPKFAPVGEDAGKAKLYLRTKLCGSDRDNYGGAGADGTITGLGTNFAICAAAFIKAASAQIPSLCIREGYRTKEKQQEYFDRYKSGKGGIACDPSKKVCEHPGGRAIDVNVDRESDYARLWAAAPDYGLTFYMREGDKYHFKPLKEGCEGGGGSITNPTANVPISSYDFPAQAPTVNPFQNPALQFLQPLMQQLAQTMQRPAPNMPQTPQITATPSVPSTSPLPTTPTPTTPSTPQVSPAPITSPTATSGTSPATNAPTIPNLPTTTPTLLAMSNATQTPSQENRPSWIDIILDIAQFDSRPTIVPEVTPVNPTLSNTGGQLQTGGQESPTSTRPSTTQTPTQGAYQGQTFTSTDSTSPQNQSNSAEIAERSRILVALAQLRAGLERFLGISSEPRAVHNAARWYPQ